MQIPRLPDQAYRDIALRIAGLFRGRRNGVKAHIGKEDGGCRAKHLRSVGMKGVKFSAFMTGMVSAMKE